ncbi:hypothetical protein [Mesorhizobium marinum]
MHVYAEKALQQAAVSWMTRHWSYRELAADVEATGDRMDSIGLLRERVIAIEVKTSVNRRMVRFEGSSGNALEAKIAATIGGVYRAERAPQLDLIRHHWDQHKPIEVGVLAGNYSTDGLAELSQMLAERGGQWFFDSRIWKWNGNEIEELWRYQALPDLSKVSSGEIVVPVMVGQAQRRPAPSLQDFRRMAAEIGLSEVLETAIRLAQENSLRLSSRPTGIGVSRMRDGRTFTILSVFLNRSDSQRGMNVGFDRAMFLGDLNTLPGDEAPRAGFLNANRFLRRPADVEQLFQRLVR